MERREGQAPSSSSESSSNKDYIIDRLCHQVSNVSILLRPSYLTTGSFFDAKIRKRIEEIYHRTSGGFWMNQYREKGVMVLTNGARFLLDV